MTTKEVSEFSGRCIDDLGNEALKQDLLKMKLLRKVVSENGSGYEITAKGLQFMSYYESMSGELNGPLSSETIDSTRFTVREAVGLLTTLRPTQQSTDRVKMGKITVVIPCLNEEAAIGATVEGIQRALDEYVHEIIVVDGKSSDRTVENAKRQGATVLAQRGKGYGEALSFGFDYATARFDPDVIVMIDGDGTYDADSIKKLLPPLLNDEADIVVGNRFNSMMQPGAMNFTNRLGNWIISWFCRTLLGLRIFDTQSGLRAFTSEALSIFGNYANGMSYATEMLADANQFGARITEIPIMYRRRIGITKLRKIQDGTRIMGLILRLMRDTKPLLFFGSIGLAMMLIGSVLGFDVTVRWIQTGGVTKVGTAILSAVFALMGIQFISLGLVADMMKNINRSKMRIAVRHKIL